MRKTQVYLLLFVSFLVPLVAQAQDAESILAKAREMQVARWDGIDSYTIERSTAGTTITVDYIRVNETSFRIAPRVGPAGKLSGGGTIVDFISRRTTSTTSRRPVTRPSLLTRSKSGWIRPSTCR